MRNIKILIAITVLTVSAYASASDLFTCKLPGGKVAKISVDGNKPTYIFGKADAPPDVQLDGSKEWHMANNHYAGANYQVTFRVANGNYNYVLYSQNYGNGLDEGLVSYKGSKILYNKKCTEATNVDETMPFDATAATYGMQDEADTLSDFIGKLDKNGTDFAADNAVAPADNDHSQTEQTQSTQPPANGQLPVKVQLQDIPYDFKNNESAQHTVTRHIYVYSLVDSVTIKGLTIDRGSCYKWDIKPYTIAYGKRTDFYLTISDQRASNYEGTWAWIGGATQYGKCMWGSVEVKTNMGDYTFNFQ